MLSILGTAWIRGSSVATRRRRGGGGGSGGSGGGDGGRKTVSVEIAAARPGEGCGGSASSLRSQGKILRSP